MLVRRRSFGVAQITTKKGQVCDFLETVSPRSGLIDRASVEVVVRTHSTLSFFPSKVSPCLVQPFSSYLRTGRLGNDSLHSL